jgi:hypothetical protein
MARLLLILCICGEVLLFVGLWSASFFTPESFKHGKDILEVMAFGRIQKPAVSVCDKFHKV